MSQGGIGTCVRTMGHPLTGKEEHAVSEKAPRTNVSGRVRMLHVSGVTVFSNLKESTVKLSTEESKGSARR
jgi:hypothetical protein